MERALAAIYAIPEPCGLLPSTLTDLGRAKNIRALTDSCFSALGLSAAAGRRRRPTAALSPDTEKHEPAGTRIFSARSRSVRVDGNNPQG